MIKELTPREVVRELDRYIVGQDDAKRMVAIALRNRYRRSQVSDEMREEIYPKNILMIGPTGVGKTEIARRLAKLVNAPFVKVEATKFTEVGYVGRDVEGIIRDLVENAIRMVREEHEARVKTRAEVMAEDRLVSLLTDPPKKPVQNPIDMLLGGRNKTQEPVNEEERLKLSGRRADILQQLRNGELEEREIQVEVEEAAGVFITVPDDVPAAGPAATPPDGTGEHVYSASAIERYLRCPAEYGRCSRIPGIAAAPDPITRGLVVHEVFRGRDPAAVLRRYGMDAGRAAEYRELYERFRASPLMQGRIGDHCEVPFLARVNGVSFEGSIDRLVQRPDGAWILVDYKTGTPGGVEDYALQMTVYHHAAARILGRPVTPYLYFVDADRWVEVAVDEERVFDTIEQAVRGIEEGG